MIKVNKKILISLALILLAMLTIATTNTFATFNPDQYRPSQDITSGTFLNRAGIVLGWIKYIGILVAVVALTIIGIKYLFSSVEGKAEYKKTMLPYVLGCFLLVGISVVLGIIESIAKV